jgi:hypothetical protein
VFVGSFKKKAKAEEGKKCHAKTRRRKKNPIELLHKKTLMCRLGRTQRRKYEGRS